MVNFNIEVDNVEGSFDKIAKSLLLNTLVKINNESYTLTEIEFYYFHKDIHEDSYTHKHDKGEGVWRFHNSGIDITLGSSSLCYGGVLIRGIKNNSNGKFTNGPRRVLREWFKSFGSIMHTTHFQVVESLNKVDNLRKTFRHLPNKNKYESFHNKNYRYIVDMDEQSIPQKTLIMKSHKLIALENI